MPEVTFTERGAKTYPEVQIDGDTGWVVATTQHGKEKWFPPHRVARIEFDEWDSQR